MQGERMEKIFLRLRSNFQESNIYSGPGIRRQGPIIGKEQRERKGGQNQIKLFEKDNLETIDCFSKGKGNFLI